MADPQLTFFLSDAHLGADARQAEADREETLLGFFHWIGDRARRLYIVGDLYDFWFEYRSVVPRRAFPIVCALRGLVDAGVQVTWMGGNHDFWLGEFLRQDVGLQVSRGPVEVELDGRRILLIHGDGLAGRQDRGYRLLRAVIRAPLSERLFRFLHPDLAFAFTRRFSLLSRSLEEAERGLLDPAFAGYVRERLDAGFDAVLTGHHHKPLHVRRDGKDWIVLGDWFAHFTYAELREGGLVLRNWRDGAPGDVVEPRGEFPGI